jgi:hypothetical protein
MMDAPIVAVCTPSPTRLIEFAELRVIAMGVNGIVADADLLGSFMLVAVTVAVAVVTGFGAVYRPCEFTEPAVAVQTTPELDPSFATLAVNCCVAPPIIDAGLTGAIVTDTGVNVTFATADFEGSVLLVAVTVADKVVITAGAVYNPLEVMEPVDAVHDTPSFKAVSPVTVALNVWVALPIRVAASGATLTLIGVRVTIALDVLVGSALLVAVTVAELVVTGVGAVYSPAELIAPADALQVIPALLESLATVAAKTWVPPAVSVTDPGLTETAIGSVFCVPTPPAPPQPTNVQNIEKARKTQKSTRHLGM